MKKATAGCILLVIRILNFSNFIIKLSCSHEIFRNLIFIYLNIQSLDYFQWLLLLIFLHWLCALIQETSAVISSSFERRLCSLKIDGKLGFHSIAAACLLCFANLLLQFSFSSSNRELLWLCAEQRHFCGHKIIIKKKKTKKKKKSVRLSLTWFLACWAV